MTNEQLVLDLINFQEWLDPGIIASDIGVLPDDTYEDIAKKFLEQHGG